MSILPKMAIQYIGIPINLSHMATSLFTTILKVKYTIQIGFVLLTIHRKRTFSKSLIRLGHAENVQKDILISILSLIGSHRVQLTQNRTLVFIHILE